MLKHLYTCYNSRIKLLSKSVLRYSYYSSSRPLQIHFSLNPCLLSSRVFLTALFSFQTGKPLCFSTVLNLDVSLKLPSHAMLCQTANEIYNSA